MKRRLIYKHIGKYWKGDLLQEAKDMYYLKAFIAEGADAADRDWLSADAFSFLMGTHFWHIDRLKTDAFRAFRAQHAAFIRQEFAQQKRLLSRKDRVLGALILRCPGLFADAMKFKRRAA